MRQLFVGSVVFAAGCTVLTGVGDLSVELGADAGTDGGSLVEGGVTVPPVPIPIPDATFDVAPPLDAAPNADAAIDADATAEAGGDAGVDAAADASGTWCEQRALAPRHCFDFEKTGIGTLTKVTNASTLGVEAPGSSSPLSLRSAINDNTPGESYFRVPLAVQPRHAAWSFEVTLDEAGNQSEFVELDFLYGAGKECALQPTLSGGTLEVNEYCPGQGQPDQVNHAIGPALVKAGWYGFRVRIDFVQRIFDVLVTRPDGSTLSLAAVALDARFVTGPAELHPGLSFSPSRPVGSKMRIDNVTLDYD